MAGGVGESKSEAPSVNLSPDMPQTLTSSVRYADSFPSIGEAKLSRSVANTSKTR